MIKKQVCALVLGVCLISTPAASASEFLQTDPPATQSSMLAASQANLSSDLRNEYLQACLSFLKNDATLPCGCMLKAHSIGGADTVSLMASYYRGEIGVMQALANVYSGPREVATRMEAALNQCPTMWTPSRGWH